MSTGKAPSETIKAMRGQIGERGIGRDKGLVGSGRKDLERGVCGRISS